MQQTTATIKEELQVLLNDQLGVFSLPNGQTLPSIWVGLPPYGTRMVGEGVQLILSDTYISTRPLMGTALSSFTHMLDLELWYPEDMHDADVENPPAPNLTMLIGVEDTPVNRISHNPFFLRWGRSVVQSKRPRTREDKERVIIGIRSHNQNS